VALRRASRSRTFPSRERGSRCTTG
jgi:hypothetical protein